MTTTYAIGDLHGRLDVLEACLGEIARHRTNAGNTTGEGTKVVFLGDYIDRGKESRLVVERLIEGPIDLSTWILLKGNHEDMALLAHALPDHYWKWWCDNGGLATSFSYPDRKVSDEHLRWMNSLPDRYQDEHRLYVHAGIKKDVPLHLQTSEMLMWVRHSRDEEVPIPRERLARDLYVVHGHTPWIDGPVVLKTRCNLDTRSYATGMASIAVFDDDIPGKPVEMLTAKAGYKPTW